MRLFNYLDGTSSISYNLPGTLTQTIVNQTVAEKDWKKLHLLFLGGGGKKRHKKGLGGLAAGCDASGVPLDEVIRCDFPDLKAFISILLEHKASQKGSKDDLVGVAIELEKFDVVSLLMDGRNKPGADDKTSESKLLQVKDPSLN